ncbi:MAG TPA: hypothetical protein VEC16_06340, partial [Alphaproteobacteria bacterium]|nr:hypothetical protein [Alphaproteobacteria bacterium]
MHDIHILQEGKAKFYASQDRGGKISKDLEVFYNPAMKFNRDVTILLLNSMSSLKMVDDLQMADIMAGSGVRSLRFMLELDSDLAITSLNVNDKMEGFAELFKKNLELNKEELENNEKNGYVIFNKEKLIITEDDANEMLVTSRGFDFIDIDPFGSPNDFLDNAITRVSRKGILAITGTDTAPLSGTYPDACERNYWGVPLKTGMMHEVGLRILIRKVQLIGGQHE